MSSDNPFAPPGAPLQDRPVSSDEPASRASRFGAAMIDGLMVLTLYWPLLWALGIFEGFPQIQPLSLPKQLGLGLVALSIYLGLHGYLLATRGQTIGKWLLGIRIVGLDGAPLEFGRLIGLRYLPFWALSLIPGIGSLTSVVDDVFIFSASRRCLHDHLAGTVVVRVTR